MNDAVVPILMYHSISTSTNPLFRQWAVAPEMFDDHLAYLSQQHYTPMTVTQLVQARTRHDVGLPARPVVLTFDDGYADFYESAFPALQRYGFVATLYVPTAYVGGTCRWLHLEGEMMRPMASWSQLREMGAGGIECGGHTHTHVALDAVPLTAAEDEIRRSKDALEQHLGHAATSFAYPHGWTTSAVKRRVQAAGYTSACAIKHMPSAAMDDPFELTRLVVTADTTVTQLARLLAYQPSPLKVTLQNIARPIWRFAPRRRAWLRTYLPAATNETRVRREVMPDDEPRRSA